MKKLIKVTHAGNNKELYIWKEKILQIEPIIHHSGKTATVITFAQPYITINVMESVEEIVRQIEGEDD